MKIATYNILKGGSKRVHWSRMIDDQKVDLLLVQESYPHDDHLPPLLYPDSRSKSVWSKAEPNGWGSGIYSNTGVLKQIQIPSFNGWVVGAELTEASWQHEGESIFVFSIHAPGGQGGYAGQVNQILDEIGKIANGRETILGGDFNLSVSHWPESQIPTSKRDLAIQARLADEFGLINCWRESNPGKQPEQTLRWTGDRLFPYHCDGIFVPTSWKDKLEGCSILAGEDWNRLSDHNPVVARFRC